MRRALAAGLGISLLATSAGAQTSLTGSRRPGIDVLHYQFSIAFPQRGYPDTLRFQSNVTMLKTASVEWVELDLTDSLKVDSVTVNGRRSQYTHTRSLVRVNLPAGNGDTMQVNVSYHGAPRDGLIIRQDSAGYWTAFGDNFPDRARQWLATVDHPSDKATVEWVVLAPRTHRVMANGELQEETPVTGASSSMLVTRWRTVQPLYTAVMVIGVAPFAVYELGETTCSMSELPGCVRQSVWTTPDVRPYMPGPFAKAGQMTELFARLVGPFPYSKLAHVQSSTRYGGMENASAIFYSDAAYRRRSMSEGLIAHEIAHQWFGDAVTTREWPHVWLSEGFATYFAALWAEHSQGDSAFLEAMKQIRSTVLNSRTTTTLPVVNEALNDLGRVLNSNVYQKAGFVLHMLRREVGDSAFFGGIRSYYMKYRHKNALTEDFQREVEASSGQNLNWFFDQWMRRPGMAQLELSWRWDTARQRVVLSATQSSQEPYRLGLTMDITDASGQVRRQRVTIPANREAAVEVPLGLNASPAKIVFDPDVSILGSIKTQ